MVAALAFFRSVGEVGLGLGNLERWRLCARGKKGGAAGDVLDGFYGAMFSGNVFLEGDTGRDRIGKLQAPVESAECVWGLAGKIECCRRFGVRTVL